MPLIIQMKKYGKPSRVVYCKGLTGKTVIGIGAVFDLESKSIVAWKDQLITDE